MSVAPLLLTTIIINTSSYLLIFTDALLLYWPSNSQRSHLNEYTYQCYLVIKNKKVPTWIKHFVIGIFIRMTVYVDNFCGDELLWPDQDRCGAECGGTFDRFHLAGQCGRERTERAQPQANLHFCSIKVASPRQTDHKLHVHPPGPNVRASHYHKYSVRNSTSYRRRINTPLITEKLVPHRRRVPHIPMPTQQNKSYRV